MPLLICKPSVNVNKFLPFFAPAALFGPADVIAAAPVVVVPPPITMPPGPAPLTNDKAGEIGAYRYESKLNAARENPTRAVFRILGEKICVSCRLPTWSRRRFRDPNKGSA